MGLWRDHGQNAGTCQDFGYTNFWLPTVMPALNKYYEERNLGLKLIYEPSSRSAVPAERIMSQYYSMLEKGSNRSLRQQVEDTQPRSRHPVGRILSLFLSESKVQAIRRLVRR